MAFDVGIGLLIEGLVWICCFAYFDGLFGFGLNLCWFVSFWVCLLAFGSV